MMMRSVFVNIVVREKVVLGPVNFRTGCSGWTQILFLVDLLLYLFLFTGVVFLLGG